MKCLHKAALDSSTRIQPALSNSAPLHVCVSIFKRKTREMIPPLKWSQKKKTNVKWCNQKTPVTFESPKELLRFPHWVPPSRVETPREAVVRHLHYGKTSAAKVGQGIPQIDPNVSRLGCIISCYNVYIYDIYIYIYTYMYVHIIDVYHLKK